MYIQTPIITASDCEGAGEMFQVTTVLPEADEAITSVPLVDKQKFPKSEEELNQIAEQKKLEEASLSKN